MYTYNSKAHRSKSLSPFSSDFSWWPLGRETFDYPTALLTDDTATISPHALKVILSHYVGTTLQDADEQMKSSQWQYKDEHDRKFPNSPLSFTAWQYIFVDQSLK